MYHNQFSYWANIQTPSREIALDVLERLHQLKVVPDILVDRLNEDDPRIIHLEVDENKGTIDEWQECQETFAKISTEFPSVAMTVDAICEEPYAPSKKLLFADGVLVESLMGVQLSPDEAKEYHEKKTGASNKPIIYRIEEEDVDGCGGTAYAYASFAQELNTKQEELLRQDLKAVKQESEDTDTDEMICSALERFHLQTGIACSMCDSPLAGVISF